MRKKAWKKNIAILLVIAMMLTIMPMTVFAEGETDENDVTSESVQSFLLNEAQGEVEAGVPFNVVVEATTDSAVSVQWTIGYTVEEETTKIVDKSATRAFENGLTETTVITATFLDGAGNVISHENSEGNYSVSATFTVKENEAPAKTITVNANAEDDETTYNTIQEAIDYIDKQQDKTGWTIDVAKGEYDRFTVLNGMDGLTVRANGEVKINVVNNSAAPVATSGAYPDTAGVSIRSANNVTLNGFTFIVGTQSSPWTSAAVSNYTESSVKGNDVNLINCTFTGSGSGIGVFINTGTTKFTVQNCSFDGLKEAISMYGDGTLMENAEVTGNSFTNCSFAIHGYYGGTGNAGTLTFADNTVQGTNDLYSKIVIQDQTNTGALKVNVRGNSLTNAIVGLVNLREDGEIISPVLENNTFDNNSFYVEATEPGTISFYASYQAPANENGKWVLTGKEDFDVDWGKNPDGSTAYIEELVAAANASESKTLNITGIDENNLIKTFTWFKDGIYWETDNTVVPVEPEEPMDWEKSKSKMATNLDSNYQSKVTLSLPSAEQQLVSDVVFVLDKSTSADLEQQALDMLKDLKKQIENTNAKVNVGVVIFNKVANVTEFKDLTTEYANIEAAIKQEIKSGTNSHAGLLAGKAMLDADKSVDSDRKYLIFVSDGITYMYNAEPTATAWSFNNPNSTDDWYGPGSWACWTGPDNWYSKYHTNAAPNNWAEWLRMIGREVESQGTKYEYPYGGTVGMSTPEAVYSAEHFANSIDKALYLTYMEYKSAIETGYHCYAMTAETSSGEKYIWGPSFMSYLANKETVDFTTIQNDIYYLLDAGSCVEDYMGYVDGDNGYNFDFINDAAAMTLKVGDTEYKAEKVEENKYSFNDGAYIVEYFPGEKDTEHFVWTMNVPVTNFAPVQLTYTVQLINPQTKAGTYGVYDADGNLGKTALYTNNRATLYPVDSNGDKGKPEEFAKPTVSYTVKEPETPIIPGGGGGGTTTTDTLMTVQKVWAGDDNATRPDSVTVTLTSSATDKPTTVTLNAANDWTYQWKTNISGWSVKEENVPAGYKASYSRADNTFTITNTYAPNEVIPDPDVPTTEPDVPPAVIDEPGVPTTDIPGTPVNPTEIAEPEVPLGDAPKTGDAAPMVAFVGLMAAAVVGLVITRRKFN